MIKRRNAILQILIVTMLAVMLSGCSTANQDSPLSLVDASGNHPDGWLSAHRGYAQPDGSLCMGCHGDDLAGGITSVSCSSDSYNGQSCHAGGPAFHPANWVSTHREFALPDGTLCMECHGDDLLGGTSGVSCSTDSFNGQSCHGSGPAFHPADWLDSSLTGNAWHGDAYDNGFLVNGLDCVDCHEPPDLDDPVGGKCIICHFTLSGGRSPGGWAHASTLHSSFANSPEETVCVACHDVNISFGNQTSCHNCHDIPTHDVEYLDHDLDVPDSSDFTTLCSTCHAITGTSPNADAPECVTCHTVGSPYTQTNCTSCHGQPPNTGKHNKHDNEGASCDDCHQGAGSGSGLNHFYDVELDIDFSESGFTYIGGKCSGLCHIGSESKDHDNKDW